jgi:RNA polymerase sigma-70 factor (ECF subfamily)
VSWHEIVVLYDGLIAVAPTLGAALGKIAAVAEAHGPAAAFELLEALPAEDVQEHQPYWAVRAHLLAALGHERTAEAEAALHKTLQLTEDAAVRTFLERRQQLRE